MRVYLDNAATTPMANEVIDVMTEVMKNNFGNPSSTHGFGRESKAIIENSRRQIAGLINAESKEIIFTSGGTEADNMAIACAVNDYDVTRIISSPIEHHAVCHSIDAYPTCKVEYVKLSDTGLVDLDHLEELLKTGEKTMVSLMHANNEISTLLDIQAVSKSCRQYDALFHSDTVQTMGHYRMDLKELDIDFMIMK